MCCGWWHGERALWRGDRLVGDPAHPGPDCVGPTLGVESISPDRCTHRAASLLETTTGNVGSGLPRTQVGTSTSYTGLDGAGVGIAVLDSGVMSAHSHFADANGVSRVAKQVNLVGKAGLAVHSISLVPGSAQRQQFEATINSAGSLTPDA